MVVPTIVRNVLTRTLVGTRRFIEQSCLFNFSEQLWKQSCEGDSDMLFLFNVVHGWFIASFGRQEATIGLLGGFIRYW